MSEEKKAKQVTTNGASEQKKQPMDRKAAPQRKKDADVTDEHETDRKEGTKGLVSVSAGLVE